MKLRQCKNCPWKITTNPREIPHGYCEGKHEALLGTLAVPGALPVARLRVMACHESPVGAERPCVGWFAHQLGPGNNIGLRLAVSRGEIEADFVLDGEQHERLQDTLP